MLVGLWRELAARVKRQAQPVGILLKLGLEFVRHHGQIEILPLFVKGMHIVRFVKQVEVYLCAVQVVRAFIYRKIRIFEYGLVCIPIVVYVTEKQYVVV